MNKTRKRFAPSMIIASVAASALIGLGATGTLGAYLAQITNTTNTAATGVLTMQETNADGSVTCTSNSTTTNVANCATINKYGGTTTPLIPGTTRTTTVKIKNTGNIPATTFTVDGLTCTQSAATGATFSGTATDLCSKVNVVIKSGTTTIFSGTAASFETGAAINILPLLGATSVAAGQEIPFDISVTLDASAGSAYQGLQISQPIDWVFQA